MHMTAMVLVLCNISHVVDSPSQGVLILMLLLKSQTPGIGHAEEHHFHLARQQIDLHLGPPAEQMKTGTTLAHAQ